MITSAVVTVFAHDAEAASAFFRDVLGFPCAHTGEGWLRFVPPTELSVHSGGDPQIAEGQHKLYLGLATTSNGPSRSFSARAWSSWIRSQTKGAVR